MERAKKAALVQQKENQKSMHEKEKEREFKD